MNTSPAKSPVLRSTYLWLTLACAGSLLPFIDKAFNIDDPLFLWTARQIQSRPLDFYRFNVNWYWSEMPMSAVTKNPPLAAYYLAAVITAFGSSEVVAHLAFLIWPIGAVLGTYRLATMFGSLPAVAALATLWTPVFLVCSTSVMCDAMMLCFWIWAIVAWEEGLRSNHVLPYLAAGVLISLCGLTKYFGITLIPLLLVYSIVDHTLATTKVPKGEPAARFQGWSALAQRWALALSIPVVVFGIYQWGTHVLYGRGLLLDAVEFATSFRGQFAEGTQQWYHKALVGLAFAGGCVFSALCFAPVLWSRGGLLAGAGIAGILIWVSSFMDRLGVYPLRDESGIRWLLVIQIGVYAAAGVGLIVLAILDLTQHRDAKSVLLFLWVAGTFTFATLVNWTINGRSILPMVPAVGILIMRRIELRHLLRDRARLGDTLTRSVNEAPDGILAHASGWHSGVTTRAAWPLVPAAVAALCVAWADHRFAVSAREAATLLQTELRGRTGTIWFMGHWGFQHHMQEKGAQILDREQSPVKAGDLLVLPKFNTYVAVEPNTNPALKSLAPRLLTAIHLAACPWLAVMNRQVGAGFYSTEGFGPLPFVWGSVPPEEYFVFELVPRSGPG